MADQPLFGQSVSPEAVKYRRALAAELMKQGAEATPIRSPWQGVGRIVQSMVGGWEANQLDKGEREARTDAVKEFMQARQEASETGDTNKLQGVLLANPWLANVAHILPATIPQPREIGVPGGGVAPIQQAPAITQRGYPLGGGGQPPAPQQTNAPLPQGPIQPKPVQTTPQFGLPPSVEPMIRQGASIGRDITSLNAIAESNSKMVDAFKQEGAGAAQRMDFWNQFRELAKRAGYGVSAELKLAAANRGLNPNAPVEQLYTDMINYQSPFLRPEGSGRLIGQEMQNFQKSLGGLMTTPKGREAALNFVSRRDQWLHEAGKRAMRSSGSVNDNTDAIQGIYSQQLPSIDIKSLMPQPTPEQAAAEARRRGLAGF